VKQELVVWESSISGPAPNSALAPVLDTQARARERPMPAHDPPPANQPPARHEPLRAKQRPTRARSLCGRRRAAWRTWWAACWWTACWWTGGPGRPPEPPGRRRWTLDAGAGRWTAWTTAQRHSDTATQRHTRNRLPRTNLLRVLSCVRRGSVRACAAFVRCGIAPACANDSPSHTSPPHTTRPGHGRRHMLCPRCHAVHDAAPASSMDRPAGADRVVRYRFTKGPSLSTPCACVAQTTTAATPR